MGGRGSNSGLSASSLGGSGGGANLPPLVVPLASVQPQQSPVALQNQPAPPTPASLAPNAPPMGVTLSDVQQMDDTSMHDFLINVQSVDMPQFLCDSHLQRMIYGLGMNDKPQIVSDKQLNAMVKQGAVPIYRTVNDSDDAVQGISMTSDDICDMMTDGSLSYVGRGVHGDGLYFSDSKRGSKLYGNPGQNPKTLRAVLNPAKARAISESSLQSAYDAFVKSHPRTRRALGFAKAHSTSDSMSQFALLMGYNVITTKVGYNETITRSLIVAPLLCRKPAYKRYFRRYA